MKGKKIFLIGFMGSGKSTIAELLTKDLHLPVKDTDAIIEKRTELTIPDIFKEHGEAFFRYLEGVVLHEILIAEEPCIISTGGGMPCYDQRIDWMNKDDLTIYLKCSVETLFKRLEKEFAQRPLLNSSSLDELKRNIGTMLQERQYIYEMAQIKVNGDLSPSEVSEQIKLALKQLEVE